MITVAGLNDCNQLNTESNNKGVYNTKVVSPPEDLNLDISKLLSFSVYYEHSVWITVEGNGYTIGLNRDFRICGSIPKEIFRKEIQIEIHDSEGCNRKLLSAVCGLYYTLYMVQPPISGGYPELAYVYYMNNNGIPLFLNINGRKPICLFGGEEICAAIDSEGSIIIVTPSAFNSPMTECQILSLPSGLKAVSAAFCEKSIFSLSSCGRLFESTFSNKKNRYSSFYEVSELRKNSVIQITGCLEHCFAVCADGSVYGRGLNDYGKLGFDKSIEKVDKFTKISALKNLNIKEAYAGGGHSLFKDSDGRIFACGKNNNGQLMLKVGPSKEDCFVPSLSALKKKASFCIAGNGMSVVFGRRKGDDDDEGGADEEELPPLMPNVRVDDKRKMAKPLAQPKPLHSKPDKEPDTKKEGAKKLVSKKPEAKKDDTKKDESRKEVTKKDDIKKSALRNDDTKSDESRKEATKKVETKKITLKKDDTKSDEARKDDTKRITIKKDSSSSSDTPPPSSMSKDAELLELRRQNASLMRANSSLERKLQSISKQLKQVSDSEKSYIAKIKQLEEELDYERNKNQKPPQPPFSSQSTGVNFLDSSTIKKLTKVKEIGRGATSEVIKVTRTEDYALKIINAKPPTAVKTATSSSSSDDFFDDDDDENNESLKIDVNQLRRFFNEYEFICNMNHPNVIKSFGFFFGDKKLRPSILLEFCPFNLSRIVKRLSDIERVTVIYEVSEAMKYIHSLNVIHRDLKPENILIDSQKHAKVCDFGISTLISLETQTQSRTQGVGTIKFMAPELLNESGKYSEKVDVYAFGVVTFFVLTKGELPKISVVDIGNGKTAKIPDYINDLSRNLIKRCWSKNSDERPSFADIVDLIKKNNFKLIDGVDKSKLKLYQYE